MARRLRPFTSTIFAEMTDLARRHDAVNLGQGFPDTDGPAGVLQAAEQAIAEGHNQYPPGDGDPVLRSAVAADRARRYGQTLDPDGEVFITVGATEGIAASLLGLLEPGDRVVLIEPYYDSYAAAVALAGGVRASVPLRRDESGFHLDLDALDAALTPETAVLVINSPHNPTGAVFSAEEVAAVARLAVERDVVVIADEVYERLTFDDARHHPIALEPGMAERTLSISSAGKTFSVTGWKVGWVTGPRPLIDAVRAAKQFMTFSGGAPLQPAVAYGLEHETAWVDGLRNDLSRKRLRLTDALREAGLDVAPSSGTYFVVADVRPLGFTDALALARRMPAEVGVAAIPVSVFTDHPEQWNHLLRFAFCKRDEVIDEGAARLAALTGLRP